MGMNTMFSGKADFSGIMEGEKLAVSEAIQKTFMDVNEEGTEAAAATGKFFFFFFFSHPFTLNLSFAFLLAASLISLEHLMFSGFCAWLEGIASAQMKKQFHIIQKFATTLINQLNRVIHPTYTICFLPLRPHFSDWWVHTRVTSTQFCRFSQIYSLLLLGFVRWIRS